jgi:hypothetical protein
MAPALAETLNDAGDSASFIQAWDEHGYLQPVFDFHLFPGHVHCGIMVKAAMLRKAWFTISRWASGFTNLESRKCHLTPCGTLRDDGIR